MGRHRLAVPMFGFDHNDPADAENIALAKRLNENDLYRGTLEGKTRTSVRGNARRSRPARFGTG